MHSGAMSYFVIDNIFVQFGGLLFLQTIGFATDTYCASVFPDLFLHAYESDFLQGPLKNKDRKLAQTFRYIEKFQRDFNQKPKIEEGQIMK